MQGLHIPTDWDLWYCFLGQFLGMFFVYARSTDNFFLAIALLWLFILEHLLSCVILHVSG